MLEQTGNVHQGRLAGARRPDQSDQLARRDCQIDADQNVETPSGLLEVLDHPLEG
jgi:hypothetical protein